LLLRCKDRITFFFRKEKFQKN
jgi:hypothetical protein